MSDQVIWFTLVPLGSIFGFFIISLLFFSIRCAVHGRPKIWRVQYQGGTIFLGAWLMEFFYWLISPVTNFLVRHKVHPNTLSWISLIIGIFSGFAYALGYFGIGGWMIIFSATFDIFDGMVARELDLCSESGDFLDSLLDRYCDIFAFVGLAWYYGGTWMMLLPILAMLGSVMVSYTRAKAESYGLTNIRHGFMQRHERVFYIGVFTAAAPIIAAFTEPQALHPNYWVAVAAMAFVAIFSNINGVIRAVQTYRELQKRETTNV